MQVKDIMSKNIISVRSDEPISRAAELMRQYNIGILPVMDGEKLCGVITDRDIVTRAVAQKKDMDSCPIGECCSQSTVCANPEQDVKEAAKTMAAQQVRRVPVMDGSCLCGMLSLGDISKNGCDVEVASALAEISKP